MNSNRWFAGLCACSLAGAALAHSPYVKPVTFAPSRDQLTVEAAMTSEVYYVAEFPIRGAKFSVVSPTGAISPIEKVTTLANFAALDVPTPDAGTYRIAAETSGGRVQKQAFVNGEWRPVRATPPAGTPPAAAAGGGGSPGAGGAAAAPPRPAQPSRAVDEASLPPGTEIIEITNRGRIETFVTRGAPSEAALKGSGAGLELRPITHPNEIFVDEGFEFEMLVDGAPAEGLEIEVFKDGNAYAEKKIAAEVKSGAGGKVALKFDEPGVYTLSTRWPAEAPASPTERPAGKRYSYVLTFEVSR